jgi:ABC-type dipeptide/oligopeptide/nickel transport system ATPase subunit
VEELPAEQPELLAQLTALKAELKRKMERVGSTEEFQRELVKQKSKLLDLETRRQVALLRDHVEKFVHDLRASQRYSAAASSINTRRISDKADELEARYRTEEFERRFEHELRNELRFARHVPVFHKRTSKARTLLTPVVSARFRSIKAIDVFSEGERTAISLAAVLAEVSITDDTAGLIFDDPISSLDHSVRGQFARRLVTEARRRQVIVFTHDLAFAIDLREEAEAQQVDYCVRTLEANEWATGTVDADFPWGMRTVNDRIKFLRRVIDDVQAMGKAGEYERAKRETQHFYDQLRATWERFIEERMFARTVVRLERNVRLGNLEKVVVTDVIVERATQGYKRCSEMIESHDHTPAVGVVIAATSDMRSDLEFLNETDALVKAELAKLN